MKKSKPFFPKVISAAMPVSAMVLSAFVTAVAVVMMPLGILIDAEFAFQEAGHLNINMLCMQIN